MKQLTCIAVAWLVCAGLWSQELLRHSLALYQLNALSLNPAYSSNEAAAGFEAAYLGNFASRGNISRSMVVNLQGATERGGLGLTFRSYRNSLQGEANLRPCWSRRYHLNNGAMVSFGLVLGLNYFDVSNSFFSNNTDFASVDGGFGLYYQQERFFAGLSGLNVFEKSAGLRPSADNPVRENPYSLHVGGVVDIMDDLQLKPVALVRFINLYELPDRSYQNTGKALSFDVQANLLIRDTYIAGLLFGLTDPDRGESTTRYGFSATFVLNRFRLTYAIQNNSRASVSLPVTHLLSAGYDFQSGETGEDVFRYF